MSVLHSFIFISLLHPSQHCFKWLLGFMDMSQEQEQDFGVLLKQGAEGRVFASTFVGRKCVIKERFSKKYRHPLLDSKLTLKRLNADAYLFLPCLFMYKQRVRFLPREARCMTKARRLGVPTPVLYAVDPVLHTLTFEHVDGLSVKDILLRFGSDGVNEERLNDIATQIGNAIGKLHDGGLVHGDLTTSNMIIKNSNNQLVLIDFGLSFTSTIPEDKAVDLYVLERALISMHSSCGDVISPVAIGFDFSFCLWHLVSYGFYADGENPGCVQKGFEAMVLHPEQAGSSEATGQEAHHGRMNGEEEKYVAWNGLLWVRVDPYRTVEWVEWR
ncbi:hypothetical protein Zm00014a_028046 [Zea mays]|uniref:non-specific serine/threonine protein kinase n=1 Tax=Zea mays TaxID=4577 RepID=A0A3L6EML7_MAIZE|nr:hypothetical protein Zm00014a_028046 [Zea mays]